MEAYILITTDAGKVMDVLDSVRKVENVKNAYAVIGPYDIIAFVAAADSENLTSLIVSNIQKITGISRTLTCIVAG